MVHGYLVQIAFFCDRSFYLVRFSKVDSGDTAIRIHVPDGAETIGTGIHNTLDAEVWGATVETLFVGSSPWTV